MAERDDNAHGSTAASPGDLGARDGDRVQQTQTVEKEPRTFSLKTMALLLGLAMVATMGIAALMVNIFDRKHEASDIYAKVVDIDDTTVDPAIWGKNYPIQYDLYSRTVDQVRTKHGGSEALKQAPSDADPRDQVSQDKLAEDPRLVKMWKGYPFSVDFREERGHAYALIDQQNTKRVTDFKQPGACLNCHASTVKLMNDLGEGDARKGFNVLNKMPYNDVTKMVDHPVSCIDCHDPKTMELRITRPAFMDGIAAFKASQGVKDYDVNKDATAQEMRAFVCAQCHVEYYFKGEEKTLTFPWQYGLTVDGALKYYDEVGHKDFTHEITGAEVLKAQHPEFEMWNQGVHARSGVSCADCHMPYMREGGTKVSDHQVRSPMLNVNRSCQTCHKQSEEELKGRVDQIQERFLHSRDVAWDALMDLIDDIEAAKRAGATDAELATARDFQRKAQFLIDYVEAENSAGFHAPGEALRILNDATNYVREGQMALAKPEAAKAR